MTEVRLTYDKSAVSLLENAGRTALYKCINNNNNNNNKIMLVQACSWRRKSQANKQSKNINKTTNNNKTKEGFLGSSARSFLPAHLRFPQGGVWNRTEWGCTSQYTRQSRVPSPPSPQCPTSTPRRRDNNNNNVHLSCAHQRPERSHDTY